MCGIAGYFNFGPNGEPPESGERILRTQISSLRYRGPDAFGYFAEPGVGIGHARLSIIDTSHAADQPMSDGGNTCVAAFNGEIYNFQEIRGRLAGTSFRTNSDTEALVEGYARWGAEIISQLRGMFAIALYDRQKDELLLIRDRVGKKPLYYGKFGDTLVYASELKGILIHPKAQRSVNYSAIHEYLTFQYVPYPLSAFEGIHKLEPGHYLRVRRNGEVINEKYFSLPEPLDIRSRSAKGLEEELVEQFKEATRLRMISDVPLGAFLSGGVDSSAVVAMMAQVSDEPVRTFTIGFNEQRYDEREYARAVAKRYNTEHTEHTVTPDALEVIEKLVYHYGEPYSDSSAIPTYYVSKVAREHVTVILSGDGGDESFFGYPRYGAMRELQHGAPKTKADARIASLLNVLPAGLRRQPALRRLQQRINVGQLDRVKSYEPSIAIFTDDAKQELYGGEFAGHLADSALNRLYPYMDAASTITSGAAWTDIHTYLPDDLLVKVDVASMANSLEVRAPFLDQEFMTWAARIPEALRFEGAETKSLLKRAMEPYLPHDLMYRPKMGFGVPIDEWLRTDLKEYAHDLLLGERARARNLFNPAQIESYLERHMAGENWATRIWSLLMLEQWFQMWVDPANPFDHPVPADVFARYDGMAAA